MKGRMRPGSLISSLTPLAIAFLLFFISFLPFGLSDELLTLGPQLVLCVVFYWTLRAPERLPPWSVFALGIAFDLFSAGPLGFWALVYLCTYAVTLQARGAMRHRGFLVRWGGFLGVAAFASSIAWALASIYFGTLLSVAPLAVSAAVTVAVYPVLAVIFRAVLLRRPGEA